MRGEVFSCWVCDGQVGADHVAAVLCMHPLATLSFPRPMRFLGGGTFIASAAQAVSLLPALRGVCFSSTLNKRGDPQQAPRLMALFAH